MQDDRRDPPRLRASGALLLCAIAPALVALLLSSAACSPDADPPRIEGDLTAREDDGLMRAPCSEDGWCWVSPLQTGNRLTATTLLPDGRRLFVGGGQTELLLTPDGGLSGKTGPGWNNFESLWTNPDNGDVWAAGKGTVYRRVDDGWDVLKTPTDEPLMGVTGADGHLFAVTPEGGLLHHDGASWTYERVNGNVNVFYGVWAAAKDDVWAAGATSLGTAVVAHYDGDAWSYVPIYPRHVNLNFRFTSIWGDGERIWLTRDKGGGEAVWYVDRENHRVVPVPEVDAWSAESVHGSGPNDVWVVSKTDVLHYDGSTWTAHMRRWGPDPVAADPGLVIGPFERLHVRADAPDDAWVLSGEGTISHYDGERWARVGEPSLTGGRGMRVVGRAADDLWVLGGYAAHYDGAEWTKEEILYLEGRTIVGGFLDAWVADGDLLRVDRVDQQTHRVYEEVDGAWLPLGDLPSTGLRARLWASSRSDVYVGSSGAQPLFHFDGDAWRAVDIREACDVCRHFSVSGIHGSGPDNVWMVGKTQHGWGLLQFDGVAWTRHALAGVDGVLLGVWTDRPGHGFLASTGSIFEIHGDEVVAHDLPGTRGMVGFVGRSSDDLYAFGGLRHETVFIDNGMLIEHPYGLVAHFDGEVWRQEQSGSAAPLIDGWVDEATGGAWLLSGGGLLRKR